jgi:glycosyltransferase involved in cell wall biosynthesis
LLDQLGLQKDVLMPGFVNNPYSWLARSAVFVLSSIWEGLPTVLIEALACGVSPVATNSPGGTAEILENGKYGFLTPVGDVPAMADNILMALDEPLNAGELRRRANFFSVENAVNRYLDNLEAVVGRLKVAR